MLYDRTTFDALLGLHACALIRGLTDGTGTGTNDRLVRAALEGQAFFSARTPGSEEIPTFYFAVNPEYGVIVINGCETYRQGANWLDGYTPAGTFGTGPNHRNREAVSIADAFTVLPDWDDLLRTQRLLIIGHSLGGGIGTILAERRAVSGNNRGTRLITFGAPSVSDDTIEPRLRETFITRWMNDDDPVPYVVPQARYDAIVLLLSSVRERLYWDTFEQTKGGNQLDVNGNRTEQFLPQNVTPTVTLALGQWLWNLDQPFLTPHSIAEYARRLSLRLVQDPPVIQPGAQQGGVIAPLDLSLLDARQQQVDLRRIIRSQGAVQGRGEIILPPHQIFRKIKVGDVWGVLFGNQLISIGWTRRKAGRLATAGNIFVRRLLRQAYVDDNSFVAQWRAFVEAAQDTNSGIRPLLQTHIGAIGT